MAVIEINNVKKTYRVYKRPVFRVIDTFFGTKNYTEHHALKGITLNVDKGETVGVLGKNGAGKSTLLKILTGVTAPTSGSVKINGKVSAILELNSGFDEELTGRENIFLKGTILGYSKQEIINRLDDIIDFADIGKYIDQPVRTYSSGMKARLGFSIAVNSDPDVLIVDEALSVGDEVFRTKCLNKMSEFRKNGKTIFFVSHSIFTIKSFCTKAAWIKDGELMDYGDMGSVVQKYEIFLKEEKTKAMIENPDKNLEREDYIGISNFKFDNGKNQFSYGSEIGFSFNYEVKKPLDGLRWTFTLRDIDDKEIYSSDKMSDEYLINSDIGKHSLSIALSDIKLLPGKYKLSGELRNDTGIIYVGHSNKRLFTVTSDGEYRGTGIYFINHKVRK